MLFYSQLTFLIVIYLSTPGRGLDRYKDTFTYWLSHSRQTIECSFGILTQCWGIFWRSFTFSLDRWATFTMVCVKLHNLCIDRNVQLPNHGFLQMFERVMNGFMITQEKMMFSFVAKPQVIADMT
jgi:hypothetical protein